MSCGDSQLTPLPPPVLVTTKCAITASPPDAVKHISGDIEMTPSEPARNTDVCRVSRGCYPGLRAGIEMDEAFPSTLAGSRNI